MCINTSGGGTSEKIVYEEYCASSTRKSENHTPESYDAIIRMIQREGYDIRKGAILIEQNGIIQDGFHRCCILLHLYGSNYKVKVLQIRRTRSGIRNRIRIAIQGGVLRYLRIFTP